MSDRKRPNVIFFFTDQQRWDSMGLHGNPLELTPNLDRAARENLHLPHCFTPQPVCTPARACLQTGRYATANGCTRNGRRLPTTLPTLARCFGEAGYATGYIGKWHLAGSDQPRGPVGEEYRGGYQYWLGADALESVSDAYRCRVYDGEEREVLLPGYRVDALTDAAIRYIGEQREEPFFLFLSFLEPHQQNRFDSFPAPTGYGERYQGRWTPPDLQALGGSSAQHLGGYWGMVRRLDEAYGRLRDALHSLGLLEDTIIVFTSDHGCHFKTRNREYKRSCHEASIRVPGVISGPGFKGRGQFQGLASLIDLMPTVLEAAGVPVPPGLDGRSLLPALRGERAPADSVYIQITERGVGRSVRTRRWKYGVWSDEQKEDDQAASYQERFLYDLEADPYELDNLILSDEHEPVRIRLRALLHAKMREAGEPGAELTPAVESAEARPLHRRKVYDDEVNQ
ncbi:MAG TPA: sulfatase-like hydrolase/transferase [Chthoniobacteraceae bacterium]|nr:sulfatase-like hydrolase/transferase [Chthoniobacteraceae bacterium]